jgi:uncharacterized protein
MTTRKDWLLVALSESADGYLSPVQIQKALFLFRKGAEGRFDSSQFYDFAPYHYGPFSPDIYYDLEELEKRGLVQIGCRIAANEKCTLSRPRDVR